MKVFNMFITAVCFIFLIKLRWPKTKSLIQFEPKPLVKNRKPKVLVKYVIIIYALGSAHERFGVRIKAVPNKNKAKFPPEPGGKNG